MGESSMAEMGRTKTGVKVPKTWASEKRVCWLEDSDEVSLEAAILQGKRNSSIIESQCPENGRG